MDEKWQGIPTESCDFHAYTSGFFYIPQICEERRAEDFFALKNPMASAGFEPANLGAKGQHATSRPPKPLRLFHTLCLLHKSKPNNKVSLHFHILLTSQPFHTKRGKNILYIVVSFLMSCFNGYYLRRPTFIHYS